MPRTPSERTLRIIQGVWVIGFLVGTSTHVADLIFGGLNVYEAFPPGNRVFWISLTLLDPLTVTLILLRRRAGIALGIAVMIADVAVNWTVFSTIGGLSLFGVLNQSAFAAFVLVTTPLLWRRFGRSAERNSASDNRTEAASAE
ncbi:hypothetical protein [Plantibacter sp. YIM 135347]|uniref:hypothetical protein n=1 Tax=Plantibacter sp. YIM 135347 TaxID=3423919 RepID=UPI003D34852A